MTGSSDQDNLFCANHPNTPTLLRCNRCGKPICMKCARQTPVGYRCKECVAELQSGYFTAQTLDYPIAGVVTLVLSVIAGGLAPWLAGLIGFYGWILIIFAAPAIAGLIAEAARRAVARRRGKFMWLVVCGAGLLGNLVGGTLLWLFTGFFPLLSLVIYVVFSTSTLYARTR